MAVFIGAAINEGVSLLKSLAPARLEALSAEYPHLSKELKEGIPAGLKMNEEQEQALLRDKAQIMIDALREAETSARNALALVSKRIATARRQRLIAQLLVLLGSSSSMATLAVGQKAAAVLCSLLALLAAIGNLIAEHLERLLNPQAGNIYDAFQRLSEGSYKTRELSMDLTLALKYDQGPEELKALIGTANLLCEELNGWLVQLVDSMHISTHKQGLAEQHA